MTFAMLFLMLFIPVGKGSNALYVVAILHVYSHIFTPSPTGRLPLPCRILAYLRGRGVVKPGRGVAF